MRKAAEYMILTAAKNGFRGIQIETMSDGVFKVWSRPPSPYEEKLFVNSIRQTQKCRTRMAVSSIHSSRRSSK